jgi:hypothetical protein
MPYWTLSTLPVGQVPKIPAIADAQAAQYKIASYAQLASPEDEDRSNLVAVIRQALLREGPITVAGLICDNFIPDANGVVPLPQGFVRGGHDFVFAGHIPDEKYFIMRNSWGRKWGLDGYCLMHEDWLHWESDLYRSIFEVWTSTDIAVPKRAKEIRIRPGADTMLVDGVEIYLDAPAFIKDNRLFIPERAVSGNQGYIVNWNGEEAVLTDPS